MNTRFFVEHNAQYMGIFKSLKCALNFIKRKGYTNDEDNLTYLLDSNGEFYDIHTGQIIDVE